MAIDGKSAAPAFPVHREALVTGLTKREYFAAAAVQGYLAASVPRTVAIESAVTVADALIEALSPQ